MSPCINPDCTSDDCPQHGTPAEHNFTFHAYKPDSADICMSCLMAQKQKLYRVNGAGGNRHVMAETIAEAVTKWRKALRAAGFTKKEAQDEPTLVELISDEWGVGVKTSERTAWVTQKEFDDLPEYSASYPTGLPIGKMWKCLNKHGRWMAEVTAHEGGDAILKWRKLVVMPKEHEDKVA